MISAGEGTCSCGATGALVLDPYGGPPTCEGCYQPPSGVTPMTRAEVRRVFDDARAATDDPDERAKIEMLREYFTNPKARRAIQDCVWAILNPRRGLQ